MRLVKMTVSMLIAYPATPNFNLTYYLDHHAPAVAEAWKPYGMGRWTALAATDSSDPFVMIYQADWPDRKSIDNMLAETPPAESQMFEDDEKNFTDKSPIVWIMDIEAGGT
jgi:hypothetical protein